MKIIKGVIMAAVVAFIVTAAVSCAKATSAILDEKESLETFNRWIAKYAPGAKLVDEGVYMQFFSRESNWETLPAPIKDTSWLLMDFTGYNIEGAIFGTRDSTKARLLGTWAYTTHFVPQFMPYSKNNTSLCAGLHSALVHFRAGDSGRVYIWSKYAASTQTFTSGYNTSTSVENFPVYYDIHLKEIVNKPVDWEESKVNSYVASKWGYTIADTISKGLYMRKLVENPSGWPITVDSTVRLRKSLYFLDGQLLSTNIDSIAKVNHYFGLAQTESEYTLQVITPNMFQNDFTIANQVYKKILPLMRIGEQVEVVGTSIWGVGASGKRTNVPQIGSYEPLFYHLRTYPYIK